MSQRRSTAGRRRPVALAAAPRVRSPAPPAAVLVGGCGRRAGRATPAHRRVHGGRPPPAVSPRRRGARAIAAPPPITAGPVPARPLTAAPRRSGVCSAPIATARFSPRHARLAGGRRAVRAGNAAAFWGMARVRVLSIAATRSPRPPPGATLEFAMTVVRQAGPRAAWGAGRHARCSG